MHQDIYIFIMRIQIKDIYARTVFDSRGNPTVETDVILNTGHRGRAIVPSGASVGTLEALELRDGDLSRYHGKGVTKAIYNINTKIKNELIGKEIVDQIHLDKLLMDIDGTSNKSNLGANAILAVSLSFAKAVANYLKKPLFRLISDKENYTMPIPMVNVINGGSHSNNILDIQEYMIVPARSNSYSEILRKCSEVFHNLKKLLNEKGFSTNVGDEGGFAPNFNSSEEVFEIIMKSIEMSKYKVGIDFTFALDVAASELYKGELYSIDNTKMNSHDLINYYEKLITKYPISSIEDAMAENDYTGWAELTKSLGNKVQLVGDDLFVTNQKILENGIKNKWANAILIKPNQIGTLTETLTTINSAIKNNYGVIISHRSGETEDTTIAHLAVGVGAKQIKTGSICRSERTAKYNELLRIEEEL